VLIGYCAEAYWLKIRFSKPNNDYIIPIWHTDGIFNIDKVGNVETKFIITLKGDCTLLFKCNYNEFIYFTINNKKFDRF
jgi:hypothetical protein